VQASAGAGFVFSAKNGVPSMVILKLILEVVEGEPEFKGEIEFTGLILSFMSFATASMKKAETNENIANSIRGSAGRRGANPEVNNTQKDLKEELVGKDLKEVWTIFEPKKLPFWEN